MQYAERDMMPPARLGVTNASSTCQQRSWRAFFLHPVNKGSASRSKEQKPTLSTENHSDFNKAYFAKRIKSAKLSPATLAHRDVNCRSNLDLHPFAA